MPDFIEIKSSEGLHIINLNHVISVAFTTDGVDVNMRDGKQLRLNHEDWEHIKHHFMPLRMPGTIAEQ